MNDIFGPLMSPATWGAYAAGQSSQAAQAYNMAHAIDPRLALNVPLDRQDWSGALNAMAAPLPGPGIHWKKTGGKSWRIEIVR